MVYTTRLAKACYIITRMKYLILSKKTLQLNNKEISQICNLKNTYWKYGLKSNLDWFKKYIKKNDIHNLLFVENRLVGYTLLRIRTFYIKSLKRKYLYFDTLIIDKKFRNKKLSNILMYINTEVIIKNKKLSFLICLKNMIKYYEKFGWKKMNKKTFLIKDYNFSSHGMCFNNKNLNKKLRYIFYFYS